MEADGSRFIISDEKELIIAAVICAVLVAVRLFYGCAEAAADELGEGRIKSFEDEKDGRHTLFCLFKNQRRFFAVFSVHKLLNSLLVGAIFAFSFAKPFFIGAGNANAPMVWLIIALCFLIAALILRFFGSDLPRILMRGDTAEKFAASSAGAVRILYYLLSPITELSAAISSLFGRNQGDEDAVTEEEILMMVDAGNETGAIESSEKEMINNVFEFHELTVSDVMTHRTDIVAVSVDAEISEVVYTAIKSGFSRIPVYRESVDHIEGMIHVKDLLCLIGTESSQGVTVSRFLRDAEFVPESCMCDDLFKMFTEKKLQIAVAVDEYGGTAGLVTMEDLVESIVGSIQDEYDNETEDISKISDDTYTIKGTADPADVMEALGEPLPEDCRYDTMSGFITDLLGRIPEDGETPSVSYKNIEFTVLLTEDMRIVRIKAVIKHKEDEKELPEDEDNKQ
ncbi:hemolysin family protein [Huintestinicola sp.]|uniref:hemolysin family protein n=1 Tax=Huintestinicola sp. TaxID=2981661 RepID=UPI003D7C959D